MNTMFVLRCLILIVIVVGAGICPLWRSTSRPLTDNADVVIIGATPAGTAAAIAASRGGANVILIEETRHVGGIISGGLTYADIGKINAVGGLFNEFRYRISQFVRRQCFLPIDDNYSSRCCPMKSVSFSKFFCLLLTTIIIPVL